MRILKFIVDGSTVKQDPACNFDGLFPGSDQKIAAEFVFSPEWSNAPKVVAFFSVLGTEYPPQIIRDNKWCMIPAEALTKPAFRFQVLGSNQGNVMYTNMLTVYQKGGKV